MLPPVRSGAVAPVRVLEEVVVMTSEQRGWDAQ